MSTTALLFSATEELLANDADSLLYTADRDGTADI